MAQFLDNAGLTTLTTLIKTDLSTLKPSACLVTLKANGWDATAKTQTVTVSGVSADEASCMIIPMPAVVNQSAYNDAGVNPTAQAANSVTFRCDTVPSADLKVWVTWESVVDKTPVPLVVKGNILSMNLDGQGAKQYRVLSMNGDVAKVVAMYDTLTSVYNSTSTTTTFGSTTAQKYESSTLDTYLNTTWYNTLTSATKAAIVPENVIQHCYQYYDKPNTPNTPTYTYQYQYNWSDSDYENANDVGNVTVGNRNVFALDLKDIYDYFDKVCITSDELMTLFWNSTAKVSKYLWLRSSNAGDSRNAWDVSGDYGNLFNGSGVNGSVVVRPTLNLDLSKIQYTVDPPVTETWVLNETLPTPDSYFSFSINFVSNNHSYTAIIGDSDVTSYAYGKPSSEGGGAQTVYSVIGWIDSAYRTITLAEPATGDLLTWLQKNAVKQ